MCIGTGMDLGVAIRVPEEVCGVGGYSEAQVTPHFCQAATLQQMIQHPRTLLGRTWVLYLGDLVIV